MKNKNLDEDLIFGSLLGDANLQTFSKGNTWRYRALQKAEHKDYLFHKYEALKHLYLCGEDTIPVEQLVSDERTGKTYKRWYFNTRVTGKLRHYANMFYTYDQKQGKWVKDVPKQNHVLKNLTPRALAYLYMDDGALKWKGSSNAMRICTESFSIEGVQRLRNALLDLYQIQTGTEKKFVKTVGETRHRLFIPERSSSQFRELIKPYLVNCMKYKVSDGNYGHL
jgi:hypothetical protein